GAHRSIKGTIKKIEQLYYWEEMRKIVEEWVKTCVPCQRMAGLRKEEELHPAEAAVVRLQVHMDSMKPGGKSEGLIGLIGICDSTYGLLDAEIVRSITAANAAKVIIAFITRYGCPVTLVSDQGSEFKAEVKRILAAA
ncbi:hypothetical protein BJ742DRAFT_677313, partial [Cladochytrium replicatum]